MIMCNIYLCHLLGLMNVMFAVTLSVMSVKINFNGVQVLHWVSVSYLILDNFASTPGLLNRWAVDSASLLFTAQS